MTGPLARLTQVLGREFRENALPVEGEREGLHVWGFAGLPTWHRANALAQYVFVNGRPVRDRQIAGAIRAAYMDYLSSDRHPSLALFVDCPPQMVDVNVHPAKAEVRFADPGLLRGLVIGALKQALAGALHRATPSHAAAAAQKFAFASQPACSSGRRRRATGTGAHRPPRQDLRRACRAFRAWHGRGRAAFTLRRRRAGA